MTFYAHFAETVCNVGGCLQFMLFISHYLFIIKNNQLLNTFTVLNIIFVFIQYN